MRFSCSQKEMAKALNTVSKAVTNRSTLPVLKGIMIVAEKNKLVLTASDMEISIIKEISATVEEEGSTVVLSKLFGDIIRKLPNEEIYFESNEEGSMTIKTDYSEFRVVSLYVEEFPNIKKIEEEKEKIIIDKNLFREMIRKTAFAASIEDSKGILKGILTEIDKDEIRMVSLDGFRLALVKEKMTSNIETSFIISAKSMNEINKIISDEDEEETVEIKIGDNKAVFRIGSTLVILRIMEGEYINYRDIIPSESTTKVLAGKEMMLESIERASLLAKEGKNNLVKITIRNDLMRITSRSEEGTVKEENIIEKTGNDIEIGFNSKYMMDVLKVVDDEKISLNFKTGVSPCIIKPEEGESYEYLVLPVRIPSM